MFTREIDLAMKYNINLTGTLTWAFEFDEHPYFDNFRVLATNKINKPIFNIFKMFGKMQARRLDATSTGQYALESVVTGSVRGDSDVGVVASVDENASVMAAMIWNYHDDDLPKPDAQVSFAVSNAFSGCKELKMTHYRIEQSHSNAYAAWLAMGSPQDPTAQQIKTLKAAAELQMLSEPTTIQINDGEVALQFDLPIHSISLLILEK